MWCECSVLCGGENAQCIAHVVSMYKFCVVVQRYSFLWCECSVLCGGDGANAQVLCGGANVQFCGGATVHVLCGGANVQRR